MKIVKLKKLIFSIIGVAIIFALYLHMQFHFVTSTPETADITASTFSFEVKKGEGASVLAERLEQEGVIKKAFYLKLYLKLKKLDTKIAHGQFEVHRDVSIAQLAEALQDSSALERTITIIPGWDLRDIAAYFVKEGLIETEQELYSLTGSPVLRRTPQLEASGVVFQDKPAKMSLEGYLQPETHRVFKDASVEDILQKFIAARDAEFTEKLYKEIKKTGRTVHEIITMASILEREVRDYKDKQKVADILWGRHDVGMGLQVDSSVHYVVGKKGDVFTTQKERDTENAWNTYKLPGLPPGPIAMPSIESIQAAIYPKKTDFWYFLTTLDTGEVIFAKTLGEHNANVAKYLR